MSVVGGVISKADSRRGAWGKVCSFPPELGYACHWTGPSKLAKGRVTPRCAFCVINPPTMYKVLPFRRGAPAQPAQPKSKIPSCAARQLQTLKHVWACDLNLNPGDPDFVVSPTSTMLHQ